MVSFVVDLGSKMVEFVAGWEGDRIDEKVVVVVISVVKLNGNQVVVAGWEAFFADVDWKEFVLDDLECKSPKHPNQKQG